MFRYMYLILLLVGSTGAFSVDEIRYRVGAVTGSDFFSYHRGSGTVEFYERSSVRQPAGNYKTRAVANYYVNLNEKEVIHVRRGRERLSGCFAGRLYRHPRGNLTVSLNNNTKVLSLFDLQSGECSQVSYDYHTMKLSWSDDGKYLEMMERKDVAFYRMSLETMEFEKLERKGAIDSIAWSPKLGRSLYIYRMKPVDDVYETSTGYGYYYVDDEGMQRKVEDEHPMTNPNGDIYYYTEFEDEKSPTTVFVDIETGKVLARQPGFFLAFSNRYAIWLKGDWVFFEGASGVLNYRTGEFVSFGTELTSIVVPFSVSDSRYAMMHLSGEDRLMVYDLEERKYIESYEPFWRVHE